VSPWDLALSLLIIATTHYLGAVAAYGSTLLAVPLLALLLDDLQSVVFILLIAGTVQSLHMFWLTRRDIDRRQLAAMLLVAGLGLPIGYAAMAWLPQRTLFLALGLVLILSGLSQEFRETCLGALFAPAWVMRALLFTGGVIHGAFAAGGGPVVVYATRALPRKEPFRATLIAFWTVMNVALAAALVPRLKFMRPEWGLTAAAVPVVLAVNALGQRTAVRMSPEHFRRLVGWLLIAAGLITIGKALTVP
jgi:uncharacterized membrane protein YfcA